jgi:hypothetical protein
VLQLTVLPRALLTRRPEAITGQGLPKVVIALDWQVNSNRYHQLCLYWRCPRQCVRLDWVLKETAGSHGIAPRPESPAGMPSQALSWIQNGAMQ